jgi:hypothetical protein
MHLKPIASLVLLSLLSGSVRAAEAPAASGSTNANMMPPTVVPAAPAVSAAPTPAPSQIVYTPRLPTAAELTSAAAAQNLSVERIDQTATQITAVYKNGNGQVSTVAYQTLPPAGTSAPNYATTAAPNYVTTTPPAVVVTTPAPAVVYEQPAPSVYYYDDPFYYPRVWYPPVSLRFGFGFGHFSHFYGRGGFHHGRW